MYLYVFGGPYLPFLKITSGGMLPLNFTLSFWWSVPLFQVPLLLCFVLFFCWVYSNSSSLFCQYFFIIHFILFNFQNILSFKYTFLTYSKELSSHFPLPYSSSPHHYPERERRQDGDGQPYAGAFSSALRYQRLSVPVLPALPFVRIADNPSIQQIRVTLLTSGKPSPSPES